MAKSSSNPKEAVALSEIEKRWTKKLSDAGWTALPSVIIEHQEALGLDALDMNIILHIASCWWRAGSDPWPSKSTMAKAMKVSTRTIQRHITGLCAAGLLTRTPKKAKDGRTISNQYSFYGLIQEALPFAEQKIKLRNEQKATRAAQRGLKKANIRVVK